MAVQPQNLATTALSADDAPRRLRLADYFEELKGKIPNATITMGDHGRIVVHYQDVPNAAGAPRHADAEAARSRADRAARQWLAQQGISTAATTQTRVIEITDVNPEGSFAQDVRAQRARAATQAAAAQAEIERAAILTPSQRGQAVRNLAASLQPGGENGLPQGHSVSHYQVNNDGGLHLTIRSENGTLDRNAIHRGLRAQGVDISITDIPHPVEGRLTLDIKPTQVTHGRLAASVGVHPPVPQSSVATAATQPAAPTVALRPPAPAPAAQPQQHAATPAAASQEAGASPSQVSARQGAATLESPTRRPERPAAIAPQQRSPSPPGIAVANNNTPPAGRTMAPEQFGPARPASTSERVTTPPQAANANIPQVREVAPPPARASAPAVPDTAPPDIAPRSVAVSPDPAAAAARARAADVERYNREALVTALNGEGPRRVNNIEVRTNGERVVTVSPNFSIDHQRIAAAGIDPSRVALSEQIGALNRTLTIHPEALPPAMGGTMPAARADALRQQVLEGVRIAQAPAAPAAPAAAPAPATPAPGATGVAPAPGHAQAPAAQTVSTAPPAGTSTPPAAKSTGTTPPVLTPAAPAGAASASPSAASRPIAPPAEPHFPPASSLTTTAAAEASHVRPMSGRIAGAAGMLIGPGIAVGESLARGDSVLQAGGAALSAVAEAAVSGSSTGFSGITGPNVRMMDRLFNAADTATSAVATGATLVAGGAAITGVGAPVAVGAGVVAGGAGMANIGVRLARDAAYVAGLADQGGGVVDAVVATAEAARLDSAQANQFRQEGRGRGNLGARMARPIAGFNDEGQPNPNVTQLAFPTREAQATEAAAVAQERTQAAARTTTQAAAPAQVAAQTPQPSRFAHLDMQAAFEDTQREAARTAAILNGSQAAARTAAPASAQAPAPAEDRATRPHAASLTRMLADGGHITPEDQAALSRPGEGRIILGELPAPSTPGPAQMAQARQQSGGRGA